MDKALLRYTMAKKDCTIKDLADGLGLSKSAVYRKCNGSSEFTLLEIQRIMGILQLDSPMEIFFEQKVSFNTLPN